MPKKRFFGALFEYFGVFFAKSVTFFSKNEGNSAVSDHFEKGAGVIALVWDMFHYLGTRDAPSLTHRLSSGPAAGVLRVKVAVRW